MRRPFAYALLAICILIPATARAVRVTNGLAFFEGVTETVGTLHVMMKRPTGTRSVGRGEIEPDGSLNLVQRVEDEGHAPYVRSWLIRQVADGRFAGSMSEASGPVAIDRIGTRYRFRFKIHGGLSVEQWLTPRADGRSASSDMTVRKFGIEIASAHAVVRKIP